MWSLIHQMYLGHWRVKLSLIWTKNLSCLQSLDVSVPNPQVSSACGEESAHSCVCSAFAKSKVSPQPAGPGTVRAFVCAEVGRNHPSYTSVNVRDNTPGKGRAVMALRASVWESELHLVHLRIGDGVRRDKSKWLFSPAAHLICSSSPLWSRSSARLIHPDERWENRNFHAALFNAVWWCQGFCCGLPIARALLPKVLVAIFIPMAAELCVLDTGAMFGSARGRLPFPTAVFQCSCTIPFYALQSGWAPHCRKWFAKHSTGTIQASTADNRGPPGERYPWVTASKRTLLSSRDGVSWWAASEIDSWRHLMSTAVLHKKMLPRHHGTQRLFQTSTASRDKQWQELLKPQSPMCLGHFSLLDSPSGPCGGLWPPYHFLGCSLPCAGHTCCSKAYKDGKVLCCLLMKPSVSARGDPLGLCTVQF